jgi:hypothetical protein
LRRKLSESARVALGNDLATPKIPFVPSFKQSADAVGTTVYKMRQARKALNGGGKNGKVNGDTLVVPAEVLLNTFTQMANQLGIEGLLDILAVIERANSRR